MPIFLLILNFYVILDTSGDNMTKEEQILKKYAEILIYKYSKANTKSKKKRIIYDLCTLSELFTIYP